MAYKSRFTGNEIDDAIGQVRSNSTSWSGKQDKLTGANGQVVGFDALGNAVAQNIPQSSGVSSFNGRTGAVTPQTGDYTAVMVGAAPAGTGVPTGGTTNQVLAKNSNTDNDIKWVDMASGPSGTTDHDQLTNRNIASQHPATSIDFTPTANVTSTNVQDAIDEVGTDRVTAVGGAQIVNIPASFGPPPYTITFTDDDDGSGDGCYVPDGGSTGQVLAKKSNADHDLEWVDQQGGGGGGSIPLPVSIQNGGTGNSEGYIQTGAYPGYQIGNKSTIEGYENVCEFNGCHIEGNRNFLREDSTIYDCYYCHIEGTNNTCGGMFNHIEGYGNKTFPVYDNVHPAYVHIEGSGNHAYGSFCHISGKDNDAYSIQTVVGRGNVGMNDVGQHSGSMFFVGGGDDTAVGGPQHFNAFRVHSSGNIYGGTYNSSGADYAEYFEWLDGNPDNEDRAGLFVTLDGEKLKLASADDDFILGIVSATPTVIGDAYDDQWHGMFETDVFGRVILEEVEAEDKVDENGNLISRGGKFMARKMNSNYNSETPYIPRSKRKEWDAVGMMGKLTVEDDGSCTVNSYCKSGDFGVATACSDMTKYRVIARLDDNHIKVLIV